MAFLVAGISSQSKPRLVATITYEKLRLFDVFRSRCDSMVSEGLTETDANHIPCDIHIHSLNSDVQQLRRVKCRNQRHQNHSSGYTSLKPCQSYFLHKNVASPKVNTLGMIHNTKRIEIHLTSYTDIIIEYNISRNRRAGLNAPFYACAYVFGYASTVFNYL